LNILYYCKIIELINDSGIYYEKDLPNMIVEFFIIFSDLIFDLT